MTTPDTTALADSLPVYPKRSLSERLDDYEKNMTAWLREPEQWRGMIAENTNDVLKLARWALEAKRLIQKSGHDVFCTDGDGGIPCCCHIQALKSFPTIQ